MDHMAVYHQMANDPNVRKFVAVMRDQTGKERRIHLTGPEDEKMAERMARRGFVNYQFLRIEEVNRPPLKEGQVSIDAYSHGIKEEVQRQRLR